MEAILARASKTGFLKILRSAQRYLPRVFSISSRRGIMFAIGISVAISVFFSFCMLRDEGCIVWANKWLRSSGVGEWVTFFHRIELKSRDMRFLLRDKMPPGGEVVIVAIDDNTIKEEQSYPLPRVRYAQLVDRLAEAGARVVAFDVLFLEPQSKVSAAAIDEKIAEYKRLHPGATDKDLVLRLLDDQRQDEKLAESFRRAMEKGVYVVCAMHFVTPDEAKSLNIQPQPLSKEAYRKLAESCYFRKEFAKRDEEEWFDLFLRNHLSSQSAPRHTEVAMDVILPLAKESGGVGFVDYALDEDGVVRSEYLVTEFWDRVGEESAGESRREFYPPLGVQAVIGYKGLGLSDVVLKLSGSPKAQEGEGPKDMVVKRCEAVRLGDVEIPTEHNARLYINFRGPAKTFPTYSLSDVVTGKVASSAFKDKVVLVGATAKGAGDLIVTPYTARLPGVEKHANVIDCILHKDFIVRDYRTVLVDLMIIGGLGLLVGLLMAFLRATGGFCATILLLMMTAWFSYHQFARHHVWHNVTCPSLTILATFGLVTLYRFSTEARSKREVKRVFEQYMQASVVTEVLRHADDIKLGGDVREITVFFSDLAGFSTISERLSPQGVIAFLNQCYDEMAPAILQRNAFLDKFWGDAIVAAFGVPIRQADHAVQACLAALDCQSGLDALNKRMEAAGQPAAKARIGLHSGQAVVGNVGSRKAKRFNYTALGDAVNVGARLESTNKDFQTNIIISGATYALAKYAVEARELGTILVKGRKEAVPVYELLGEINKTPGPRLILADIFHHGLELFRKRDWDGAIFAFQKALAHTPNDGPSLVYLRACKSFKETPPPEDWHGILVMKEGKD